MNSNNQYLTKEKGGLKSQLPTLLLDLLKKTGKDYFDSLVEFLCKETNSSHSFVGEYNSSTNSVTTKSFLANNNKITGFKYNLKDSPCETVVGINTCIYPNNVQQLFPKDGDLKTFGIESYAGIPLYDISNTPVGLIVIMSSNTLKDVEQIESLLELVKSKTEFELERLLINSSIALSQKDFISTFENFQDVFFWINYNEKIEPIGVTMSPSVEKTFGYTVDEVKKLDFNKIYAIEDERTQFLSLLKTEKNIKNYPLVLLNKNQDQINIEIDAELLTKNLPKGVAFGIRGVFKDVTSKVREKLRTDVAYLIAEKSQRRLVNLNLLGEFTHSSLKEILPISNLYIATIDFENKLTYFPYFKDDFYNKDLTEFSRPFNKNGFTEYVIQNKKLININREELLALAQAENLDLKGDLPEKLIGIPLKSDGLSVGALVVQCYENNCKLNDADAELLRFIASQIAVVIDRKNWQDQLVKNEEYYRSLVENSSEIICILDQQGNLEYISESCEKIIGFLPHEIIGKNISEFVKTNNAKQIIQGRLKSKPIKDLEVIKINTKNNQQIYLELSIANFSNNKNNNRLIINAKNITEKIILEKKRAQEQKKLEAIHKIEKALITDKDLKETLSETLKVIAENIYNVEKLCIGLVHQKKKTLEIIAIHKKDKNQSLSKKNRVISFNNMTSINAILKKKPFYAKNLNAIKSPKKSDLKSRNEGILSYYITPLIINNKVVGTLSLSSSIKNCFDNIDENLIQEIATLLAVVLNNDLLRKDLANRESDLTAIVNNTSEGIVKIDKNGAFLVVNKSLCDMLGYSEKELLTKKYTDITFKGDLLYSENMIQFVKNSKKPKYSFNKRYINKNGSILDCRVSLSVIYDKNDKIDYYVAFIFDETERNQAIKKINDLKNVLNNSANVLFTDVNGIIIDANEKIEQLSGYNKEELIGKTPKIFNSNFHSQEDWSKMWNTIKSGNKWQGEIKNKKKNGELYWVFVTITPIYNNIGEIDNFIAIQFDITQEKLAKTFLVQEVIEAQERERERFAMEIHDGLGQVLLASKMNLNAIGDAVEELDVSTKNIYNKSMDLLTEAVQEARNISHGLMSRVLTKFGLLYAINEIVNNINTSQKLKINLKQNIDNIRFDEELEMGLYRTLQELINNIIKHSQAKNAALLINKKDNKLLVEIKDDGVGITKGFDNNPKSNGIGLKNMKSRIEYLGGKFIIDNTIKKGTKINIELALQT